MTTKLFNIVNLYDSAAAINATAAEMLCIDISTIGGDVTVTFPATGVEGQCIGIQVYQENGTNGIYGAGPVDVRPFSLSFNSDCALWTWDPGLGMWMMVSQYHQPQAEPLEWLTPAADLTTPVNGEFSIDSVSSTVTLPEAPAHGTFIAVKTTNGTTTVQASGADSIDQGNGNSASTFVLALPGMAAMFVYNEGDATWWIPGHLFGRGHLQTFVDADLSGGVLTVNHNLVAEAPLVQLYDNTGRQVPPEYAAATVTATIDADTNNTLQITFAAALLPLTGTWTVRVSAF